MWFYKDGFLENINGYFFSILEKDEKFNVVRGRYKEEQVGIVKEYDNRKEAIKYIEDLCDHIESVVFLDNVPYTA